MLEASFGSVLKFLFTAGHWLVVIPLSVREDVAKWPRVAFSSSSNTHWETVMFTHICRVNMSSSAPCSQLWIEWRVNTTPHTSQWGMSINLFSTPWLLKVRCRDPQGTLDSRGFPAYCWYPPSISNTMTECMTVFGHNKTSKSTNLIMIWETGIKSYQIGVCGIICVNYDSNVKG